MGGIANRLGRLEGATPCPECDGPQAVEYEVVWQGGPDERLAPELCPRCGEPLEIVVTWNDPPASERLA